MPPRPSPADIELIATGGHFEARTAESGPDRYLATQHSRAQELLSAALGPDVAIKTLPLKDSSSMTDEDRSTILEAVQKSPLPRIVIIHGTTTLDTTARYLHRLAHGKTIVLTGTTAILEQNPVEAHFNLGAAIGLVQALPTGVYGVMNGRIIPAMNLRKDERSGRFDIASGEYLLFYQSHL